MSGLDFFLEFSGGGARSGEDGRSVSVLILIDEFDGVVESGDVETDENRAEDFFLVAGHVFGYVGDDGWSDLGNVSVKQQLEDRGASYGKTHPVTIGIFAICWLLTTSIKNNCRAFLLRRCDETFDPLLRLW